MKSKYFKTAYYSAYAHTPEEILDMLSRLVSDAGISEDCIISCNPTIEYTDEDSIISASAVVTYREVKPLQQILLCDAHSCIYNDHNRCTRDVINIAQIRNKSCKVVI